MVKRELVQPGRVQLQAKYLQVQRVGEPVSAMPSWKEGQEWELLWLLVAVLASVGMLLVAVDVQR